MGELNDLLVAFTGTIDDFMYTYILVILLVATGVWFTIRTRFVQIRYIKDMFTNLVGKSVAADTEFSDDVANSVDTGKLPKAPGAANEHGSTAYADVSKPKKQRRISSFQALMVSTASRVGTGNIVGIATAIAIGGPGAVFWMWLMAIIGAASAFVESTLAQIWKVRNPDGTFRGVLHSTCARQALARYRLCGGPHPLLWPRFQRTADLQHGLGYRLLRYRGP